MSLNLYTYCANNPLIYHDPTGHKYEFSKFWNNLRKDIRNSAHSVNKSVRNNINSVKKSISNSSVGKITDKFIKDTKKTLAGGIKQVSGLKSLPSAISGAFSSIGKAIKDIPKAIKPIPKEMSNAYQNNKVILHKELDFAGLAPVVGVLFDAVNTLLYLSDKDYANSALSGVSMIPFVGAGGTVTKVATKYGDEVFDILKHSDEISEIASGRIKGGVDDLNLKINIGQQNKHIPGTNNYKQELANGKLKSILSADPQQLLDDFAGTGQKIGTNKERVDFGNVIGKYVNPETGEAVDTTVGIIHYGKNGAHIVPARPK